jgi:iron(III) transport system substrate-binding protein
MNHSPFTLSEERVPRNEGRAPSRRAEARTSPSTRTLARSSRRSSLRANGLALLLLLTGCPDKPAPPPVAPAAEEPRVVVYCAHDRDFAEPILDELSKQSGLAIDAKWDAEATKTTGLIQLLEAEKERPRCDLLWSNEAAQAAVLAKEGVIEGYTPFAARARVLLVNASVPEGERPRSIEDLGLPKWKGKVGIANPLFGTTATHVAALVSVKGEEWTRDWLRKLKANDVAVCAGNADVKNRVVAGELAFGLTDSDDANVARLDGNPVVAVFPDQAKDGLGTLVIPNAIGIVKGAPRPGNAKKLADLILTPRIEDALARSRAAQLPLLPGSKARPKGFPEELVSTKLEWGKVADCFARARDLVKAELLAK